MLRGGGARLALLCLVGVLGAVGLPWAAVAVGARDVPLFKRGHMRVNDPLVHADDGLGRRSEGMGMMQYRSSLQGVSRDQPKDAFMFGSVNATFEYYVALQIGSSQQLFLVQADTGSSVLAVPTTGCKEYTQAGEKTSNQCLHPNALYAPASSTSAVPVPCSECSTRLCSKESSQCLFQLNYGDGSFLVGYQYKDAVSLGGYLASEVRFGAIKAESPGFAERKTAVDGILGLAYTDLDAAMGESLFEEIVADTSCPDKFGICLGYSGGVLSLGSANARYNNAKMEYTPLVGKKAFYQVEIANMMVGGDDLFSDHTVYAQNRTIVDSGTTLLILPQFIMDVLTAKLRSACVQILPEESKRLCYPGPTGVSMLTGGACSSVKLEYVKKFPDIQFQFSTGPDTVMTVALPADRYFMRQGNAYCFGITGDHNRMGGILGDVFMQAVNTEFDRKNSRIGFAPVKDCVGPDPILTKGDGDGQTGAKNHALTDALTVKVEFNIDHSKFPAGGLVILWSSDQDVKFGDADSPASVVDPTTGVANISIIPQTTGDITITATVMDTDKQVTFKIKADLLIWWEYLIIIGAVIVYILAALGGAFLARRYIRKREGRLQGRLDLTEDTGDGLLGLLENDESEDESVDTELITTDEIRTT